MRTLLAAACLLLILGGVFYVTSINPTLIVLLVMVLFSPLVGIIVCWPSWKGENAASRVLWRLVIAMSFACYYAFGPLVLLRLGVQVEPLVVPQQLDSGQFIALLVILASIFIALAAQQAAYVNRLDDLRQEIREECRQIPPQLTAAYLLVSLGFWAFSFAVPVILALIGIHFRGAGCETIYGIYEATIAVLFVGGWIVLMAGALRRFQT